MAIDKKTITVGLATLVIGLLFGWMIFGGSAEEELTEEHQHASMEEVWTCSMHPQIRQSEPGKCPICGMDLIPLESGMEEGLDPNAISMSPTAMQLANISTLVVGVGATGKAVTLTGKVQADERLVYSQTSHIPGRIEQLQVNFTGEFVKKGQVLAYIYSPELVSAQEELLEAWKIKDSQPQLLEASKQKLKNWKLRDAQIEEIITSGKLTNSFPILADVSGNVTNKVVNLGDHVTQGETLFEVTDFSRLWILFDVYESNLAWVKEGNKVEFKVASLPGETFEGVISFIDPTIDPNTRVATARVEIPNKSERLKPEMFVSGIIDSAPAKKSETIAVPKSAVMWTGKRSVVYVKQASSEAISFIMREVTLGEALGESFLIEKGLNKGEEIAVNGTFSIDAAAQLAGKPSMMNPMPDGKATAFNHDHMVTLTSNEAISNQPSKAVPEAFRSQLTTFIKSYMVLKDALVNDDPEAAAKAATDAIVKLNQVDMKLLSDHDIHMKWMAMLGNMNDALESIASKQPIVEQRNAFINLSNAAIEAVSSFGINNVTLYQQHCPMANSNKGADWLSLETDIKNPYYGDAMLACGSVEKTITPFK